LFIRKKAADIDENWRKEMSQSTAIRVPSSTFSIFKPFRVAFLKLQIWRLETDEEPSVSLSEYLRSFRKLEAAREALEAELSS
jgi:hypothetical protein